MSKNPKYKGIKSIVKKRVNNIQKEDEFEVEEYINLCTNTLMGSDFLNKDCTIAYRSVVYSCCEYFNLHGSRKTLENYYTKNYASNLSDNKIQSLFINDIMQDCVNVRSKIFDFENRNYKIRQKDEEMEM